MRRFTSLFCILCSAALFAAEGEEIAMVPKEGLTPAQGVVATKPAPSSFEGLADNFKFSGDVRTAVSNATMYSNGNKVRGAGGLNPSTELDNIKVNLKADYKAPRLWSSSHLKVSTNLQKTVTENLLLEKFVVGGRVWDSSEGRLDAEAGRRRLVTAFDSKLQFASMTDGLVFNVVAPQFGNAYLKGSAFLRSVLSNAHPGFAMEAGLPNIAKSGAFVKYSFVDWDTKSYATAADQNKYAFANSQLTVGHQSRPTWLGGKTPLKLYAAALVNHKATPKATTGNTLANYGGYAGVSMGKSGKQGDWMVDANYQLLAAQAVPSFDALGLRSGNHKGVVVSGAYQITDNLSVRGSAHHASKWKKGIGPTANGNYGKVEFVFGF